MRVKFSYTTSFFFYEVVDFVIQALGCLLMITVIVKVYVDTQGSFEPDSWLD